MNIRFLIFELNLIKCYDMCRSNLKFLVYYYYYYYY